MVLTGKVENRTEPVQRLIDKSALVRLGRAAQAQQWAGREEPLVRRGRCGG